MLKKYTPNLTFNFLLHITALYMLGIGLHSAAPLCAATVFCACLVVATFFIPSNLAFKKRLYYLILPLFLTGSFFLGRILIIHKKDNFRNFYTKTTGATLRLIGTVKNIAITEQSRFKSCVTLDITEMQKEFGDWSPLDYTIQIYTHDEANNILVGDTILLSNITFKQTPNNSFSDYLVKEGIAGTIFIKKLNYLLVKRPTISLSRCFFYARQNILTSLKNKMTPVTSHVFASLFLGNKNICKEHKEPTKDAFSTWGLAHYLARSGLHLIIIITLWGLFLQLIPLSCNIKHIMLLFLGIIYAALSWTSVSFNRAFLTFLFYKTCTLLRIRTNLLHLLTVVCLFTLIHNPMQLFFLDFQLSFSLTFALALFNHLQTQTKINTVKS